MCDSLKTKSSWQSVKLAAETGDVAGTLPLNDPSLRLATTGVGYKNVLHFKVLDDTLLVNGDINAIAAATAAGTGGAYEVVLDSLLPAGVTLKNSAVDTVVGSFHVRNFTAATAVIGVVSVTTSGGNTILKFDGSSFTGAPANNTTDVFDTTIDDFSILGTNFRFTAQVPLSVQ